MKLKNKNRVFKLTLEALCLAFYIVLSMQFTTIKIANILEISFGGLAIIVLAVICGPIEGAAVGFLGEFVVQLFGYGITPTTALWCLPAAIRGLVVGLLFKHKTPSEQPIRWALTNLLAGLLVTLVNTLVIYLDAKIFEYPSGLTSLTVVIRFVSSITITVIYIILIPIILDALEATGKIKKDSN